MRLIDNHKRNANVCFEKPGRLWQDRYGVSQVVIYRNLNQSLPIPAEALNQLARTCDAISHKVLREGISSCGIPSPASSRRH